MKHVLEHDINWNRLHKGSLNGRSYETFSINILLYDDETNKVYNAEAEYDKFDEY